MDPIQGIVTGILPVNIGTSNAITQSAGLLASELSLSTPGLFSSASAIVDFSGNGQLLAAAATFQNQLQSLQPGTPNSGGGQNFGTDLPSLAAEAQSFVDSFNGLQGIIANINYTSNLQGESITSASGLAQSLSAQAQASFDNGNSTLTNLSQLGIVFNPSEINAGSGSLSINLNTLQSAFNTDAAGAFSLLSKVANSFSDLAGSFVAQSGGQSSSLAALTQSSAGVQFLTNSLLSQAQANGNLTSLQAIESLPGVASSQQVLLALNEYALVSGLLG